MQRVAISISDPDPEALERAAAILRRGGRVAFPTETVYGLGANALDDAAVLGIFAAKGRPSFNPLIAHAHDVSAVRRLVAGWPQSADDLAQEFWPGPLTLVLPKREVVPEVVTAGLPTVAVRVPAHPVALALLRTAGLPLAAPSANRYTEVSPTTADHVAKALGERVDLILDAGPTAVGIESTVLDLSSAMPRLLRPGTITREQLERVIGPIEAAPPLLVENAPRPSPGMGGRHYAPRARLRLFAPADRADVAAAARRAGAAGERVGALLLDRLDAPLRHSVELPKDPAGYASRLYASLHWLDEQGCELILVERVPDTGEWAGVRDRLERAAHG